MRVNKGIIGIGIGVVLAIVLALVAIQSGLFASLYKIILKDSSAGYSAENVQSTVLHGAAMGEKFMIEENGNTGEWIFVYPSSATQTSSVVFTPSEISMLISGEEIVKSIQGSPYIFFIDSFPVQGMNPYPKVLFASFGGNVYGITANTKNKSLDTFISNFLSRQSNGNSTNNNEGIFGGLGNTATTSANNGNTNTGNTESFINTNGNSGVISGAIGNNSGNTNQNRNAGNVNTMFPNFGSESLQRFANQNANTASAGNTGNNFATFGVISGSIGNTTGNTSTQNNGNTGNTSGTTQFFKTSSTTNNNTTTNNNGGQESYGTGRPANGSDTSLYLTPDQCKQLSQTAQAILCAGGANNGGQHAGDQLTNNPLTDEQKQFLENWAKKFGSLAGGGAGTGTINDPLTLNINNVKAFIDSLTGAGKSWLEHSNFQDKDYFYYVMAPCGKDGQNESNPFAGQACSDSAKIVIRVPKTAANNQVSQVFTRPIAGTQGVTSCAQNGSYAAPAAFDEWADGYKGKDAMGDYQKYVTNFSCSYCGVCSSAQTVKNTNGECGATAGACNAGTASSVTTGPNNYVWTCGLTTCKTPKSGAAWTRTKSGGCVNGVQKFDVVCKDSTGAASTACSGTKPADSESCTATAGTCGASTGACSAGTSSGVSEGPNNYVWSCGSTVCKTPKSATGWVRTKSGGCVNGVQKFDVVCKDSNGAAATGCSGTAPAASEQCASPTPSTNPNSNKNTTPKPTPTDEMYRPNHKPTPKNEAYQPTPNPSKAPKATPIPSTPNPSKAPKATPIPSTPNPTPVPSTPKPTPYIPPVDQGGAR